MDKRLIILIGVFILASASFFVYRKLVYKHDGISYTIKPNRELKTGDSIAFNDNTPGASRWKWDFGDGEFSADQAGNHTYLTPGQFTVRLTVYGPFGILKDASNTVVVLAKEFMSTPVDTISTKPVLAVKEEPKPAAKPAITASAPIQMPPQQQPRPAQVAKPKPVRADGARPRGNVLEDLGDGEEIKK